MYLSVCLLGRLRVQFCLFLSIPESVMLVFRCGSVCFFCVGVCIFLSVSLSLFSSPPPPLLPICHPLRLLPALLAIAILQSLLLLPSSCTTSSTASCFSWSVSHSSSQLQIPLSYRPIIPLDGELETSASFNFTIFSSFIPFFLHSFSLSFHFSSFHLSSIHSLFIRSFSSFHYIYIPSLFPSFLFFISLLRHLISFSKQILYSFHPFLRFILSSLIRFLTPFFSSFHSFSIPSFSLFLPFLHFVPPSFLCSNRCLVTYNYRPLTSSAESWYLFKLRQMSLLSRPIPRVGVAPAGRINLRCFHYLSLNGACVYLHDLITSDC